MDENQGMSLEKAISRAWWTHNTNIIVSGYNLLTLITGKSVVHLEISIGNMATESKYKDEVVRKTIERLYHLNSQSIRKIRHHLETISNYFTLASISLEIQ